MKYKLKIHLLYTWVKKTALTAQIHRNITPPSGVITTDSSINQHIYGPRSCCTLIRHSVSCSTLTSTFKVLEDIFKALSASSVSTCVFLTASLPHPNPPVCPLPRVPVQRQLWVRGGGLVWWLSSICCTSCSTEKPELLFPLLQVHLMPWTAGREETQTSARQPHRPAPRQHFPTETAGERQPNFPYHCLQGCHCHSSWAESIKCLWKVICLFLQKCPGSQFVKTKIVFAVMHLQ